MKKEIKICLPVYKICYSLFFVLILSLVRGIGHISEIGIAMETPVAFLTMIFCADTYLMERQSGRAEIFSLYSLKKRTAVIRRRLAVQMVYLLGVSMIGYGLFYLQKPAAEGKTSFLLFGMFLIAIVGTILFFGILSLTISNLFQSIWMGIGGSLLIWTGLNSQAGDRILGKWNIFSFTFRDISKINNWSWGMGKLVSVFLAVIMVTAIPLILKKRG